MLKLSKQPSDAPLISGVASDPVHTRITSDAAGKEDEAVCSSQITPRGSAIQRCSMGSNRRAMSMDCQRRTSLCSPGSRVKLPESMGIISPSNGSLSRSFNAGKSLADLIDGNS